MTKQNRYLTEKKNLAKKCAFSTYDSLYPKKPKNPI